MNTLGNQGEIVELNMISELRIHMWYVYTVEYYSAMKRGKIMSFVEMWMDLETVIHSEVRQRKTNIIY